MMMPPGVRPNPGVAGETKMGRRSSLGILMDMLAIAPALFVLAVASVVRGSWSATPVLGCGMAEAEFVVLMVCMGASSTLCCMAGPDMKEGPKCIG